MVRGAQCEELSLGAVHCVGLCLVVLVVVINLAVLFPSGLFSPHILHGK